MHFASIPLLATFLLAITPFANAAGDGPTFCQTVDKLKVTSPLTFIRPVPSFNLKWSPSICLCQSDGELTDKTVNLLNAKITAEGIPKLAKKLGLDTLPDYWEESFVRQAVIDAADAFLDQYKTCPRGCEYPKGAIPNSCKTCDYDCPKNQKKCNGKCIKKDKPCPSKTSKPPHPPKTTSSDGYPTYPTEYPTTTDEYPTYPTYRKRDASQSEDVVADLEHYVEDLEDLHNFPIDEWKAFLASASSNAAAGTPTFAVSDIPEPTLIQQYYRSQNDQRCEPGWIPCAVPRGSKADWECTDVQTSLDSCGGCIFPIGPGRIGTVCSDETGADEVACVQGQCIVKSCQHGFAHNGTACNPHHSHKRYTLE